MATSNQSVDCSKVLLDYAKPYIKFSLVFSLLLILCATVLGSYSLTDKVDIEGMIQAQSSTPALWILDVLPLLLLLLGGIFFIALSRKADGFLLDKAEEFKLINSKLMAQLQHHNTYDDLTNLPNQTQLLEKLKIAIKQIDVDESVPVILINIKGFNNIIINFGNYNTNIVLKKFADKLKRLLVEAFMLDKGLGMGSIGRLEGDKFLIFLPRMHNSVDAQDLLQKMQEASVMECMVDGNLISIHTCIGAAFYPKDGEAPEILLNKANIALEHAHKKSVDVAFYTKEMEENLVVSRSMLDDLKKAIEEDALKVFFQPIVELKTGKITGAEALIRFDNPEFGLIHANKLIPLVEGMHLIKQLTALVLRGVIKQLVEWKKAGHELTISINLTPADVTDLYFPQKVFQLLEEVDLPTSLLKFEISERVFLLDSEKTKVILQKLADKGIKISVEDFCSGYTSFAYLTQYPIHEIKIDKSFVLNMVTDSSKFAMVNALIQLAKIMKVEACAIGVESKEILEKLIDLNCVYGQGFYFSKAINVRDFNQLLKMSMTKIEM